GLIDHLVGQGGGVDVAEDLAGHGVDVPDGALKPYWPGASSRRPHVREPVEVAVLSSAVERGLGSRGRSRRGGPHSRGPSSSGGCHRLDAGTGTARTASR